MLSKDLISNKKYMTKQKQVYKCEICGNIVEVLHSGAGELVCCGQAMNLLSEQENEADGGEKHLPVGEILEDSNVQNGFRIKVKVGSVAHPMEDNHYIEWIEVETADGEISKRFLNPGDQAEVIFYTQLPVSKIRSYCNIHGLWSTVL